MKKPEKSVYEIWEPAHPSKITYFDLILRDNVTLTIDTNTSKFV